MAEEWVQCIFMGGAGIANDYVSNPGWQLLQFNPQQKGCGSSVLIRKKMLTVARDDIYAGKNTCYN